MSEQVWSNGFNAESYQNEIAALRTALAQAQEDNKELTEAFKGLVPDFEKDGERVRDFLRDAEVGVVIQYYGDLHIVIDGGIQGKRLKALPTKSVSSEITLLEAKLAAME